jgi:hypothetical protein
MRVQGPVYPENLNPLKYFIAALGRSMKAGRVIGLLSLACDRLLRVHRQLWDRPALA